MVMINLFRNIRTLNASRARQLTDSFFAGDTTPEQERALYAYYCGGQVDPSLEQYRQMFGWYASLQSHERQRRRRYGAIAAGICFLAALAAAVALLIPVRADDNMAFAGLVGSYIIRNGVRCNDLPAIERQLEQAEQQADSLFEAAECRAEAFEMCYTSF